MKIRKALTTLTAIGAISLAAACGTGAADTTATDSTTTSSSVTATTDSTTGTTTTSTRLGEGGSGPAGGVDVSSVSTEAELVALIQDAYGDGSLDLHRGHQPVQDVLNEVLTISHDELHVRMDAGQNLAAVAEDLGIDPQTLIDALVASRSTAIDQLVADGTITDDQAEQYLAALEEAFTFRVTWNGTDAMPTFSGIDA